jgi:hypothetical protein
MGVHEQRTTIQQRKAISGKKGGHRTHAERDRERETERVRDSTLLTSFLALILAPLLASHLTTAGFPSLTAIARGVFPLWEEPKYRDNMGFEQRSQ